MNIKEGLKEFSNATYSQKPIDENHLNAFKDRLSKYYRDIDSNRNRDEEYLKNLSNNFFKETFYSDNKYSINTEGRIDSAITKDNKTLVFFEFKSPNNTNEMIKADNLNKKAMHETVFYYLEERKNKSNLNLNYILITDTINWFVFNAQDFDRIFFKPLKKEYEEFTESKLVITKREDFYSEIIQPYFEAKKSELDYIYFNLDDILKTKNNITDIKQLYKIFHPDFLLKEYSAQDVNVLNKNFYDELLYIMGLKEKKEKGKPLIIRDENLKNSFLDIVYKKLIDEKDLNPKIADEVALELVISWINRILFIKLFESQLIAFNHNNPSFAIINNKNIANFKELNELFFKILNKELPREEEYKKFDYIPYLNSSLFELSKLERDYFTISNIDNNSIKLKTKTNLKNWDKYQKYKTPKLLEYLLDFLKSYDFSSSIENDLICKDKEDLINASVLGLIFEKINGYQDGAVYTPGLITEYIAKESLQKVVIDKFNGKYNQDCKSIEEVRFAIKDKFNTIEKRLEIAELINSLKICDPAVGSGHFLVSVLNQLIAIKSYLGAIFKYETNDPLTEYEILVEDDTLVIIDGEDKPFVYDKTSKLPQQIQQTLFNEKRILIENCLFGVDINSKSVQICRLRLWIELLKNAYYKPDGTMETLPNIDINIKDRNSLTSNIAFEIGKAGKSSLGNKISKEVNEYRKLVNEYKNTSDKNLKKNLERKISSIYSLLEGSYSVQLQLTGKDIIKELEKTNSLATKKYIGVKGALEWAIAFPEVLADDGTFLGFDLVIGNPPYFNVDTLGVKSEYKKFLQSKYSEIWQDKSDICFYFIKRALDLLPDGQIMSFIISNAFLRGDKSVKLRNYILKKSTVLKIIDFEQYPVFKGIGITTCIIFLKKAKKPDKIAKVLPFKEKNYEENYLLTVMQNEENYRDKHLKENSRFVLDDDITDEINKEIDGKHPKLGTILKVGSGMQTAKNPIFAEFKTYPSQFPEQFVKPRINGEIINKYFIKTPIMYVIYYENISNFDDLPESLKEYLRNNRETLEKRATVKNENRPWWRYSRPVHKDFYNLDKIWCSYRSKENAFAYDDTGQFIGLTDTTVIFATNENYNLKYVLALLNSKVLNYRYKSIGKQTGSGLYEYFENQVYELPIPEISLEKQQVLVEIVDKILEKTKQENYLEDEKAQEQVLDYQNEIDEKVYQLYNLSKKAIEIIKTLN